MNWKTDPNLEASPSRQIVDQALDAIANGELTTGDPLPSVRKMAAEALVNHNTAARAYRELEVLGVVRPENGKGVFVTRTGQRIARKRRRDETMVVLKRAIDAALRAGHDAKSIQALVTKGKRRGA